MGTRKLRAATLATGNVAVQLDAPPEPSSGGVESSRRSAVGRLDGRAAVASIITQEVSKLCRISPISLPRRRSEKVQFMAEASLPSPPLPKMRLWRSRAAIFLTAARVRVWWEHSDRQKSSWPRASLLAHVRNTSERGE